MTSHKSSWVIIKWSCIKIIEMKIKGTHSFQCSSLLLKKEKTFVDFILLLQHIIPMENRRIGSKLLNSTNIALMPTLLIIR